MSLVVLTIATFLILVVAGYFSFYLTSLLFSFLQQKYSTNTYTYHEQSRSNRTTPMTALYEYPVSIPVYPMRIDNYTGLPVQSGLIHHVFEEQKDAKGHSIDKKMTLAEFNKLLQCPTHQPDLGISGVFEMLKLIPTTADIVEMMCAYSEQDGTWKDVQNNRKTYKSEGCKYLRSKTFGPNNHGNQRFRLHRVTQGQLYADWPFCAERMTMERIDTQYLHPLHFVLTKVTDIGDSVFFMGGQDSYLPWNHPFLHFHPAPSVMTNHVPWPWPEAFKTEFEIYQKLNSEFQGNFSEHNIQHATGHKPWDEKIPKAGFYASYVPWRHLAYELSRIYPGEWIPFMYGNIPYYILYYVC